MKRLLIFFLLLFSLARGEAQTTTTSDRVVTKSLYLRDWWVDSVKRDTNFLGAARSIPTAAAVYNFVAGRGAPGYTSVTSLPDSSGLVFHGPNGVKDTVVFEGETGGGGSSLPSMTGNAGKVLTTDGSAAQWSDAVNYDFTNPQPGQRLVLGPDGSTIINTSEGGAADSIAVYGTTDKAAFMFRPSDTALVVTWAGTAFTFKQGGSGSSAPASSPYDAYFTNLSTAGLTLTSTQQGYFNDFYNAITAAGATITEHYPFMGSSAATQAVTVKGKTVTWGGDVGHNAKGIVMQFTSTGYVGLGVAPSADFELDNFAALWYNVNGDAGPLTDMGCGSNAFALRVAWDGGSTYADIWDGTSNRATGSNTTVNGPFLAFRNSGTIKMYRSTTEIASATGITGGTLPGLEVYLGGINSSGSVIQRTNRDVSQVIFLKGVTAANAATIMSAWTTLNTNLGKN